MWDLNDNFTINTIIIDGSPAYIIDDFYKNPDDVAEFLFWRETPLWKNNEANTRCGFDYEDKRFDTVFEKLPLFDFLENLCGQKLENNSLPKLLTNQARFLRNSYNERYKTHHWWAHIDCGYNGLVYFNKDDNVNGTNLYDPNTCKFSMFDESVEPWQPKSDTKVLHTFKPKFNRLVLFDGLKFPHSMAINDDRYHCDDLKDAHWSTFRSNQVFFFDDPEIGTK